MDELPQPGSFSIGPGRSRFALGRAAAQFAFMASIAFWLAQRGVADAMQAPGPASLVFDFGVPLLFGALGLLLAMFSIGYVYAFALADRPCLVISDEGLDIWAIAERIAWADIEKAFVYRGRGRASLVIWLTDNSGYRRRVWPFWPAGTINLGVADPDGVATRIRAHPGYRGVAEAG